MVLLIFCSLVVVIPWGIELFYYRIRFGIFALFCGLFALQVAILFACDFILSHGWGESFPTWLKSLGGIVAALSLMTFGFVPLGTAVSAIVVCAMAAVQWAQRRKSRISG